MARRVRGACSRVAIRTCRAGLAKDHSVVPGGEGRGHGLAAGGERQRRPAGDWPRPVSQAPMIRLRVVYEIESPVAATCRQPGRACTAIGCSPAPSRLLRRWRGSLPAHSGAHRPWHNSPVLDGRVGTTAPRFRIWVTAPGLVVREVLQYRELALLAVALACLAGLIIIRVRRRREAARGSVLGPLEAETARGRHAVAGPAGGGELRTAWPDLPRPAAVRRGVPDPGMGRPGPGTRRPADQGVDEPGWSGSSPGGPRASGAPAEEAYPAHGPPARGTPTGTLQAWGFEHGDHGARTNAAGPPWKPAEMPLEQPPWAGHRDRAQPRQGHVTAIPPPRSSDDGR